VLFDYTRWIYPAAAEWVFYSLNVLRPRRSRRCAHPAQVVALHRRDPVEGYAADLPSALERE